MRFVTPKQWQHDIEPMIASWARTAGPRWRRHRARVGPWVLEYIGDHDRTFGFFSLHWKAAAPGEPPDAYCYHLSELPQSVAEAEGGLLNRLGATSDPCDATDRSSPRCVICIENCRAIVCGPAQYAEVNQISEILVTAVAARSTKRSKVQAKRQPSGPWWVLGSTCVEYQTESGDCRSVALLGGPNLERSAHGYALSRCKPQNALLSDGFTCVRIDSHTAFGTADRVLWPSAMARIHPHLIPHLATSPLDGLDLDEDIAGALRDYRNASDLARAIDAGLFAEQHYARMRDLLANAGDARSLVDPRDVLGADRHPEQSQITDLVRCTLETDSNLVVREVPPRDFIARCALDFAEPSGGVRGAVARIHENYLNQLLQGHIRPVLLDTRLGIPPTQFCLRHFLEGRSDSVQVLTPASSFDPALLHAMSLEQGSGAASRHSPAAERCFVHGPRQVELVSFERQGQLVELVAFDPSAEGYAQVRAVWPGQVADFFSRHAGLRIRELFTETSRE